GGQEPERVAAGALTASAFEVLGVEALVGRTFTAEEDKPGADGVVVLGHGLWQRRFGRDPSVVGTEIQVNGRPRTVVGIMPAGFRLPLDYREEMATDLWIPAAFDPADLGGWGNRSYIGMGRLRSGISPEAATLDLDRLLRRWFELGFLEDDGDGSFQRSAVPVRDLVFGDIRPALTVLAGAVGFVLLIACANVANLLLARSDRRRREVSIRAALGAGRGRLVAQLLTESLVLAAMGGAAGVALAYFGLELLVSLDPANVPRVAEVGLSPVVLGFTAAITLVTGILFGLVPALRISRTDLTRAFKESTRSTSGGRERRGFRQFLVVTEMALSVVLLIGAGLLIRSFVEMQRIDLGFEPENVLTMRLSLPSADYPESTDINAFYDQLVRRVETLPGVESAGATRLLPLTGTIGDWGITIQGRPEESGENPNGDWQVVTPGYFETMGMSLLRGRFLTDADRADAVLSVAINETMAERYWPGEDPLGERFKLGSGDRPWFTIVGVVKPVRHNAVVEDARAEMYVTPSQFSAGTGSTIRGMTLVAKTTAEPSALVEPVRAIIRDMDQGLAVSSVRSLEEVVSAALSQARFTTLLLGIFAALALALSAIGIYGVLSFAVSQRMHEMGIRIALGAERNSVLGLVVGQGMMLALAGIAAGTLTALFLTGLMESFVYGVTTLDAPTFLFVPALLAGVALLASYIPARRATLVDPVTALRAD
ncbi:MAG TPA: ABC transporter permease, partial [Longimicrobiaceae bacterium]|nr:ABC transporter permease [Longimicrobiaceae bacterium]